MLDDQGLHSQSTVYFSLYAFGSYCGPHSFMDAIADYGVLTLT